MKKIEHYEIMGSGIELPPLVRDSEGFFRGGFIGIDGNELSKKLEWNIGCKNNCDKNDCVNIFCHNDGCGKTTTGTTSTTDTTNTAAVGFSLSLLI